MFGGGGGFGQIGQTSFGAAQPQQQNLFGQPQQQQQPAQTGFGFGAAQPAFGAVSAAPSAFGQPQQQAAPFGTAQPTNAFGGFGQPQQQQQQLKPFGAGASLFGGSTSQAPSAFGGGNIFSQPTGGFGQPQQQQPAATANLFGAKPGGVFGGGASSSQSAFGAPSGGLTFGSQQPTATAFGTPAPAFGTAQQQPMGGMGGAMGGISQGTGNPPFTATHDRDASAPSAPMNIFQTITAMPAYRNSSVEELRLQDYQMNKKFGGQQGFGAAPAFGAPTSQAAPAFGAPSAAFGVQQTPAGGGLFGSAAPTQPNMFGQTQQQPAFGGAFGQQPATSQPGGFFGGGGGAGTVTAFGGSSQAPAAGGFGFGSAQQPQQQQQNAFGGGAFGIKTTAAPAFGGAFGQPATSQPAFGFGGSAAQPAFSQAPATNLFGAPTPATGAFGAPAATSGGLFGQQKPGGLFGQPAASTGGAFGSTPAQAPSLFGQPAAAGGMFGRPATSFGAPNATPAFGGVSAAPTGGLFGTSAAAPTAGFGGQQGMFGAASQAPATGAFGAPAPNAFGTGALGGSLFGQKPATAPFGGLSQAPTSTFPAFGTGQFGTQQQQPFSLGPPAAGQSLFGAPTAGASTGGLFGGQQQPYGGQLAASQQLQQALYATQDQLPWGSNPVFDKSREEVEKGARTEGLTILPPPHEVPQKSALLPYIKLNPRGSVPARLRAYSPATSRVLTTSPGSSIFDGTAKDDIILGLDKRYTPRRNLKKLVVTSDTDVSSPTVGPDSMRKRGSVTFDENLEKVASERGQGRLFVDVLDSLNGNAGGTAVSTPISKVKAPETTPNGNSSTPGSVAGSTPRSNNGSTPGSTSSSESPERRVPRADEYIMSPSVPTLLSMTDAQLKSVHGFTITHPKYGRIRFLKPVNLLEASTTGTREGIRHIPSNIVVITHKNVTVYPDDTKKPPVGHGLNVEAEIELEDCFPLDKHTKQPVTDEFDPRYLRHIKKLKAMPNTKFGGLHREKGSWLFTVEHFSRYGLDDDTDDEGATNTSTSEVLTDAEDLEDAEEEGEEEGEESSSYDELEEEEESGEEYEVVDEQEEGSGDAEDNDEVDNVADSEEGDEDESMEPDSFMHVARRTPQVRVPDLRTTVAKPKQSQQPITQGSSSDEYNTTQRPTPLPYRLVPNVPAAATLASIGMSANIRELQATSSLRLQRPEKKLRSSPPRSIASQQQRDIVEMEASSLSSDAMVPELSLYMDLALDGGVNKYRRIGTVGGIPLRKSIVYGKDHLLVDAGLSMGRSFRVGWGVGGTIVVLAGNKAPGSSPDRPGSSSTISIRRIKIFGEETPDILTVERKRHEKTLSAMLDCTEIIPTIAGSREFEEEDTQNDPDSSFFDDDIDHDDSSIHNHQTTSPTPRAQVNENLDFDTLHDACLAAQLALPPIETDKQSPIGIRNLFKDEMRIWELASALWDDVAVERIHEATANNAGTPLTDEQVASVESGIRKDRVSAWLRAAIKDDSTPQATAEGAKGVFQLLVSRDVAQAVETCLSRRDFRLASIIAQLGGAGARVAVSSSSNNIILPPSSGHKAPGRGGTDDALRENVMDQVEIMSQHAAKIDPEILDVWLLVGGDMDKWNAKFFSKCVNWKTTFGLFMWYADGGWSRVEEAVATYDLMLDTATKSFASQALASPIPAYVERGFTKSGSKKDLISLAWLLLRLHSDSNLMLDDVLSPYGLAPRPLDLRVSFMLSIVLLYAKAARDAKNGISQESDNYRDFSFSDDPLFEDVENTNNNKTYLVRDPIMDVVTVTHNNNNSGGSRKFDELVTSLSFALESLGLWQWSIYVTLFSSYREAREARIRYLLQAYYPVYDVTHSCWGVVKKGIIAGATDRHSVEGDAMEVDADVAAGGLGGMVGANDINTGNRDNTSDEDEETWKFVVERLKVPAKWVHEAKALRARYQGEKLREAIYLIDAQHYSLAHKLIIVDIAPDFMLEGDHIRLRALLSRIPDHVEYWARGGSLLLQYLDGLETLPNLLNRAIQLIKSMKSKPTTTAPTAIIENEHFMISHRRARQEVEDWHPKLTRMLNELRALASSGLLGAGLNWVDCVGLAPERNESVLNGRLCVAKIASKVVEWAEMMEVVLNKKILSSQVMSSLPLSEDQRLLHVLHLSTDWYSGNLP
ncbi:hypothetical protein SmJEL517_g02431 [Synchytrium microbalum]|uniref:Peptidase S59 domain-containing protein n=1 Tax=Synchytrium microbalum TaxID=1806994 RepID=A0A507C1X0_9FUNG|nr:uncharacterized protein SmJEL517_g02431 [Synchytrium microbalum]TPX35117.1 hypothetical protein SmJEL517_g02431 [Synchytrium microbalum]